MDSHNAELVFRHKVLGLLRDRDLITQERIDLLRSWRNSGFGVHNRTTVYPQRLRGAPQACLLFHATPPSTSPAFAITGTPSSCPTSQKQDKSSFDEALVDPLEFLARVLIHIPEPHKHQADPRNPGPNEFNTVHSIAISDGRRLFVVDRGHGRFQVFDEEGKFLDMFPTGPQGLTQDYPLGQVVSRPYAHLITAEQMLWVADGGTNRILKYDLNGKYLYGWGQPGKYPGQFGGPHALTVDQAGNLYVAEVFNGRVQKFRPKPGADPSKLVGQEKRYRSTSN